MRDRAATTQGPAQGSTPRGFVPALRFGVLTPAYDAVVRLTTRERVVKASLLDAARLDRATGLLDIGCGTGTFAIAAKRRHPDVEVVGVDPDDSILKRAREKAARAGVDVTFLPGSAAELPVSDEAFDRVTSSLVFHHLTTEQKEQAAAEIDRVLTRDGEFHLADWVQPSNALMKALFWSVRALDGLETTSDHAHGRLLQRLRTGGLIDVTQHHTVDTPAGTIGLISARAARTAGAGLPAGAA